MHVSLHLVQNTGHVEGWALAVQNQDGPLGGGAAGREGSGLVREAEEWGPKKSGMKTRHEGWLIDRGELKVLIPLPGRGDRDDEPLRRTENITARRGDLQSVTPWRYFLSYPGDGMHDAYCTVCELINNIKIPRFSARVKFSRFPIWSIMHGLQKQGREQCPWARLYV
jgi:hypothetical protein